MRQLQLTGNGVLQRLKKPFTEKRIKADQVGNPLQIRQEHPVYGMTPDHHTTITYTDKMATRIRAKHHQN